MDSTRAIPGADLSGPDFGHEGGSQPMLSLRGTCAAAYEQPAVGAANTGAPHPGPNAMDGESPDSGSMSGGATWTYKGGGTGDSARSATA